MRALKQGEFLGQISHRFDTGRGLALIETIYQMPVYQGLHAHQNSHLTLFLRGGTFEKRKFLNYGVVPGNLLFYHSGELHQNLNTQFPSRNINLDISAAFFAQQGYSEADLNLAIEQNPNCRAVLLKIYKEVLRADQSSPDSITMLFHQLFEPAKDQFPKKQPVWVMLLREMLQDCWQQTPALDELAHALDLNPITISRYFPRYFGCTLSEYSRRLKIARAVERICQPAISLTAIAYECGFADQSHFTRVFKEQTGFLPRQFQRL